MGRLETLLVHAGAERDAASRPLSPPIELATTFEHLPDGGRIGDHEYARESQPVQARLETVLCAAEGGAAALAFGSGMAAVAAAFQALPRGAHALIPAQVYHGVRALASEFMPGWGLACEAVDMSDLQAVSAALRADTALVWAETPSNPTLALSDIAALAELAHARGALLAVDNTFATPVLQRPLALGADLVMHSTTKYFGGHSDVMGGALVFAKADRFHARCAAARKFAGAVASPFSSWLVLRGARTLACRVERHCRNARAVAAFLSGHAGVSATHYPGLAAHPGHAIAARQMSDFGGMVSFEVAGGREAALRVAGALKLFTNATSLGGCESLVEHRASVEGVHSTTPAGLLRLSVGLEAPEDLVADLDQALGRAAAAS